MIADSTGFMHVLWDENELATVSSSMCMWMCESRNQGDVQGQMDLEPGQTG